MNNKQEKNFIASEAETITSAYGVLAGLTFTASVLIFSFRTTLPFGDVLLTLSLVTTIFFVYSVLSSSSASEYLRNGNIQKAKKCLRIADDFAGVAVFMML